MIDAIEWNEKPIESVDHEKIILDAKGNFPRRIIIMEKGNLRKEYRLIKTQSGNFILNK